jgi:hypothetical protein
MLNTANPPSASLYAGRSTMGKTVWEGDAADRMGHDRRLTINEGPPRCPRQGPLQVAIAQPGAISVVDLTA